MPTSPIFASILSQGFHPQTDDVHSATQHYELLPRITDVPEFQEETICRYVQKTWAWKYLPKFHKIPVDKQIGRLHPKKIF